MKRGKGKHGRGMVECVVVCRETVDVWGGVAVVWRGVWFAGGACGSS